MACLIWLRREFKEAPVEAIAELSRGTRLPTLLIYNGAWYAFAMTSAYLWACIDPASQACKEEHDMGLLYRYSNGAIGFLECVLAVLMYFRCLPVRWIEPALCAVHVLQAGFVLNAPSQYQFNMFADVALGYSWISLALMGVRLAPCIVCIVLEVVLAACIARWSGLSYSFGRDNAFDLVYAVVLVIALQHHWAQLHDCQNALQCEQEASEVLFTMLADAKFWVACDGNTIISRDPRLDDVLGMPMFGKQLDKHMLVSDKLRWKNAIHHTVPGKAQSHAELITMTLEHRTGAPVDVELFIVDRRHDCDCDCLRAGRDCQLGSVDSQGKMSGFFIGLRLVQPAPLPSPLAGSPVLPSPCSELGTWPLPQRSVARAGTCDSIPSTMLSAQLPPPQMSNCSRQEFEEQILSMTWSGSFFTSAQALATLSSALQLVCDRAQGGALLCIAEKAALDKVFCDAAEAREQAKPCLRTSDAGYMTNRLKGIHISDDRFTSAFAEFTEHSESDRWPEDHPDMDARNQPKDGAFLISTSGYCLKCAVKILGLPPPRSWTSVGTKHEAALACAWAVQGCCVLVRSDGGAVHVLFRDGNSLIVKQLDPGA